MSDEARFLDDRKEVSEPILPSVKIALALIALSVGILFYSSYVAETGFHFTLFGSSLGLAGVALYALMVRARGNTAAKSDTGIFEQLANSDPHIAVLSDVDGAIIAGRGAYKAANLLSQLGTTLPSRIVDFDAQTYRILNAVRAKGFGDDIMRSQENDVWYVSASRLSRDRVVWRFRELEALDGMRSGNDNLSVPVLHITPSEDVVWANAAAVAVTGAKPSVLTDLVVEVGDSASGRFVLRDQTRTSIDIVRTAKEGGLTELILVPRNEADMRDATPEAFLDALPVAVARIDVDGKIIAANEGVRELLGKGARTGVALEDLMEGLGRSISERISDMFRGRSHMRSEVARAHVDGQEVYLQVTLKRFNFGGGPSLVAVISDATELKTLEAQFVQSQKMQAVGQLAGGVAHDFNNLLTAISGHCDLLLMRHEQGDADHGDLIQVRQNANRAASLVGQLLAFSRKQTLLPKVLNLYETLTELSHLLNRLLGEKVRLKIEHGSDLHTVRVDERQFEQVVMNLVVNARDAMPHGGEVHIRTSNVHFVEDFKRDRAVVPFGDYVCIEVVDTGSGISGDKLKKIFEPFFTTKSPGEGTGLGLSTVYGIIKQTGGFIFADSKVDEGSKFTIYLPVHANEEIDIAGDAVTLKKEEIDLSGKGVVLLVEDELPVRSFAARALDIRGYTVIEAASAEEALDILEDDKLHIDIFVSDVIMPGMNGPTWVKKARERRPDTKVIFVSGYAEDAFDDGDISIADAAFLPKPFSLNDLTQAVKEQIVT